MMRKKLLCAILCVLLLMTTITISEPYLGIHFEVDSVSAENVVKNSDYKRIKLDKAWKICTGKGVNVAIIDTGLDLNDPEIASNIKCVYNAQTGSTSRSSVQTKKKTHGLSCAKRIVSVAPDVNLYVIKAAYDDASAYTDDIIDGIEWARKKHCRVVNISYTGGDSPGYYSSIARLAASGKSGLVCAAVGNANRFEYNYPASFDNTLSAGSAVYKSGKYVAKGTYNDRLDIVLPVSSSSAASACACGIAALLFQANPSLTAKQCRKILQDTALDLGDKGKDAHNGYGLVQPYAAVKAAVKNNSAIKINQKSITMKKGKTVKLRIAGTNAQIKWSSSKADVASVSKTGKVTAKKKGKTTITAAVGSKKYKCVVNVSN